MITFSYKIKDLEGINQIENVLSVMCLYNKIAVSYADTQRETISQAVFSLNDLTYFSVQ